MAADTEGHRGSAGGAEGPTAPPHAGTLPLRIHSVRWTLRSRLAEHPRLYLPLARRRHPDAVLSPCTELVIDGFTRSAVTFATIAFQLAQHRPVRVAHTLHSAGHVLAAVRREVPVLVTIREPDEVVLSAAVREPHVSLGQALDAYARFYSRIMPHRQRLVIGEFSDVTRDFGRVIRELNTRFGTAFDEFRCTERNVSEVFSIIDDRARWPPWSKALGQFECGIIGIHEYRREVAAFESKGGVPTLDIPERRVQRPSEQRVALKEALRDELRSAHLRARRDRARATYEAFLSG